MMPHGEPEEVLLLSESPRNWPCGAQPFGARAFGTQSADLDVDFRYSQRPFLITQLLVNGIRDGDQRPPDPEQVWNWPLPVRMQALLAIAAASAGRQLPLQLNCSQPACGEFLELELDLADLAELAGAGVSGGFACRPAGAAEVSMRLPTGDDQRRWLATAPEDLDPRSLAARLVVAIDGQAAADDWKPPAEWLPAMSAELERHDRLMDPQLQATCPSCGADVGVTFDVETTLLDLLAGIQRRLLEQIHCLASAYHWSEAEIIALPPHRRRYYLARLEDGALR